MAVHALLRALPLPPPPAWLHDELERRVLLWINHVLAQENAAIQRLMRQQGRVVWVQWRQTTVHVRITPAGLLEPAGADTPVDLRLELAQDSALTLAQSLLQGHKPPVHIEGDVQLAADLGWLMDHVRWDFEEDLARVLGDATAHHLAHGMRTLLQALQGWVNSAMGNPHAPRS